MLIMDGTIYIGNIFTVVYCTDFVLSGFWTAWTMPCQDFISYVDYLIHKWMKKVRKNTNSQVLNISFQEWSNGLHFTLLFAKICLVCVIFCSELLI